MIRSDRIFGVVMILVAAGFALGATKIQIPLFPDPLGPKFFPLLLAAGMAVCGLAMVLLPDAEPEWPETATLMRIALSCVVLVVYAYTLKPMGFVIPTAICAAVLSFQIAPRWLQSALTGILLSVGLFVIFKYFLGLGLQPFPKAWMG